MNRRRVEKAPHHLDAGLSLCPEKVDTGNRTTRSCVVKFMPTFTPPTYENRFAPERPGGFDLMRFYRFPVGYSVLITGGVATPHPGRTVPSTDEINSADVGSGFGNRAAFIGGRTYEVTAGEKTILETAGYAVTA